VRYDTHTHTHIYIYIYIYVVRRQRVKHKSGHVVLARICCWFMDLYKTRKYTLFEELKLFSIISDQKYLKIFKI
jgi:hypothetical protein